MDLSQVGAIAADFHNYNKGIVDLRFILTDSAGLQYRGASTVASQTDGKIALQISDIRDAARFGLKASPRPIPTAANVVPADVYNPNFNFAQVTSIVICLRNLKQPAKIALDNIRTCPKFVFAPYGTGDTVLYNPGVNGPFTLARWIDRFGQSALRPGRTRSLPIAIF